jgi:hypothetical protein
MPPRRKEATEIEQYRALGMSDAEIKTVLLAKANRVAEIVGRAETPISVTYQPEPLTADRAADQRALRADPEVVAAHAAKVASLPPQPEPETFLVTLEPRWAGVLRVYRDILRGQRNEPELTCEQALAQLVRWAYGSHPDIKLVTSQGKAAFVHPDAKR